MASEFEDGIDALHHEPPARRVVGLSGWIYHGKSLGVFEPAHPLRRQAIKLIEHWLFEPLIMIVITLNCAELAWESPLDPPGTWKADFIDTTELCFLVIFTVEALAKILACGFACQAHAYLRDPYCKLDATVVIAAWVPYFVPDAGNYTSLRTIRASARPRTGTSTLLSPACSHRTLTLLLTRASTLDTNSAPTPHAQVRAWYARARLLHPKRSGSARTCPRRPQLLSRHLWYTRRRSILR